MDKELKDKIINQMEQDIVNNFKNINTEELKHLSNNLFILCLLKAKHFSNQEIINLIMNQNSSFLSDMQTKGVNVVLENYDVEIELYTKLKNKYIRIIRKNITT